MTERKPSSPRKDTPGRKDAPMLGSLRTGADRPGSGPWRQPTRRAFVAMLGAAAAALAIENRSRGVQAVLDDDRPRSRWTGTTRWIGHC